MKKLGLLETIISSVIIIGVTVVLFLYTNGYRLNKNDEEVIDFSKTGMISVKSMPDGASVYLDGKLATATDDAIQGIEPGVHKLKIVKKGFFEWTKDVEVFEELVTDITAVLVSVSPRLEPLTNTGAKYPSISPTRSKLAYFSTDTEEPGIWVIPLNSTGLGLFRSNPTIAIQDTRFTKFSEGQLIQWSPDENSILVSGINSSSYIVNLENNTATTVTDTQEILNEWEETTLKKRESFIEKFEMDDYTKSLAISDESIWAPDQNKFLYTVQAGETLQYKVYNLEEPLPVGENRDTLVLQTNLNDPQPKLYWYDDSFHLIMVEGDVETNSQGKVSLIRIDGTNKAELYNSTLFSDEVFSAPGGDKVIMLTSFKSGDQTDLYTLGIR